MYPPGGGGEFFSFLLESHKSEHWTRLPLCCFTIHYNYTNRLYDETRKRQIRCIHRISYSRLRPVIFLKAPAEYLVDIRRKKAGQIPICHNHSWIEDNTEEDSLSEQYADITISHLNPLENYYEMCDLLEMEPDIKWYAWAWWNYLGLQDILLKKKYSHIAEVRRNLKECFGDFNGSS